MSKRIEAPRAKTIDQAIDRFLLSCKVEGKSYGTIECYTDKLKGFRWYAANHGWLKDIKAVTTDHLREFLAYLRDTPHRFNSTCPRCRSVYLVTGWHIDGGPMMGLLKARAVVTGRSSMASNNLVLPEDTESLIAIPRMPHRSVQ